MNAGDDAGAAGFSFSFGADGEADLVAMFTEVGSGGGIFFQFGDEHFQVFFEGAVFLHFENPEEGGPVQLLICFACQVVQGHF